MAGPPARSSDLPVRVLSALVMLAIVAVELILGGIWFLVFIIAVGAGLIWEWVRLVRQLPWPGQARASFYLLGLVYIVAAVAAMAFIQKVAGSKGLLVVMALVWATDVGAYFSGRAIGGPKIAPAISPSKTWAGLAGGIVAACATLYLAKHLDLLTVTDANGNSFYLQIRTLAGVLVACVAQAGDFFESWVKRLAGVKDSSQLIPGHGGLLDRLDGLLPVAILAALWLGFVMT